MAGYFEKKLFDLLPPLYRIEDETGDVAAFLKVPAVSLDELKKLIERFPISSTWTAANRVTFRESGGA